MSQREFFTSVVRPLDDPDAVCECGHPAYTHTGTLEGDCLHRDPGKPPVRVSVRPFPACGGLR